MTTITDKDLKYALGKSIWDRYICNVYSWLSYYEAAHYSTLKLVKNRIGFKEDFSLLIESLRNGQ